MVSPNRLACSTIVEIAFFSWRRIRIHQYSIQIIKMQVLVYFWEIESACIFPHLILRLRATEMHFNCKLHTGFASAACKNSAAIYVFACSSLCARIASSREIVKKIYISETKKNLSRFETMDWRSLFPPIYLYTYFFHHFFPVRCPFIRNSKFCWLLMFLRNANKHHPNVTMRFRSNSGTKVKLNFKFDNFRN